MTCYCLVIISSLVHLRLSASDLFSHFYWFRMNVNVSHSQTGKVARIRYNYKLSV